MDIADTREQDKVCIEAFLGGDISSFDRLVLRYKDKVFNLCFRLLGDYEEANDCGQEIFVKVYRSLNNFKFNSSFSTWLYTITVNHCKNRLRSLQYRFWKKVLPFDPVKKDDNPENYYEIEDPSPSPFTQMADREKEAILQQAINALPQGARAIVILRDMEGLPYEEIARITGYNPGTVKSKLARARQLLREQLKGS